MNVTEIKNLEQLISLGIDKKIFNYQIKRLTAPGENYGSLMLSVDATVENANGTTEEIHMVAKLVPPNEFIQEVFNTQVTFRNEIAFYKYIVPALQNFQRECGVKDVIDLAPRCFGSRINLKDDTTQRVDSNAALVLENLKIANFVTIDRIQGLDFDAAKLVMKNLAYLHAVPLALKIKKPEVFEKEIKPYLTPWKLTENVLNDVRNIDLCRLIDEVDELQPIRERILAGFDRILEPYENRELFATVTHNDCWTNNNMFKLNGNKAVGSKMVDYQMCSYGSPGKDVVFFLFSSVQNNVLTQHYDDLIDIYFKTFLAAIAQLNVDTKLFTFEAFQKELDFEARYSQFGHIVFMLFPIYTSKESVQDLDEFQGDKRPVQEISDLHKEKFLYFIKEFVKKNWI